MITKEFAKKHIFRLAGTKDFPTATEAVLEMVLALQVADYPKQAEDWVSGFLEDATAETRCPSPGDIRRALYARKEAKRTIQKCPNCDGAGWVTVYRLVTYKPNTYLVQRAEAIQLPPDDGTIGTVPGKFIEDFRKKLGGDQDILTAAKACVCLPTTHKYFTGERQ